MTTPTRAEPTYPQIWDRVGPRKIIGETRLSWLVEQTWTTEPAKVNKKTPNRNIDHPQWFFDAATQLMEVWADTHFHAIKESIGRHRRSIDAATLHRVAEVIGYLPTLASSQPDAGKKTIDEVTREDVAALVESAMDLLSCARFMFWVRGGNAAEPGDTSVRDSLDRMAAALNQIGITTGTIEEFDANIESILKSGKHPTVWAADQLLGSVAGVHSPSVADESDRTRTSLSEITRANAEAGEQPGDPEVNIRFTRVVR